MRRKLLFVIPTLGTGGAEKSLITLLKFLDYEKYEVDLLVFKHQGIFMEMIPAAVNVLPPEHLVTAFQLPFVKSILKLATTKPMLIPIRIWFELSVRLSGRKKMVAQQSWGLISKFIASSAKNYDVAIAYLEQWPIYYVIQKVAASRKIGFIHTDYKAYGLNSSYDDPFLEQLDYIITVSDHCKGVLSEVFPDKAKKIFLVPNIISPKLIFDMAKKGPDFRDNYPGTRILTVGRLELNKGYDLAIEVCRQLIHSGYKLRWYAIGADGPDKLTLVKMIKDRGLENSFVLLGPQANPYTYMSKADIYVHPSRYEGRGIVVDEAKVLCKPIVVTSYPTALEQIQHLKNGIITPTNVQGLYTGVKMLLDDQDLQNKFAAVLGAEKIENEKECVMKLEHFLNGN